MLFAADGISFTEFVLDHRLTRAHRMLTDPRYAHLEIGITVTVHFIDIIHRDPAEAIISQGRPRPPHRPWN